MRTNGIRYREVSLYIHTYLECSFLVNARSAIDKLCIWYIEHVVKSVVSCDIHFLDMQPFLNDVKKLIFYGSDGRLLSLLNSSFLLARVRKKYHVHDYMLAYRCLILIFARFIIPLKYFASGCSPRGPIGKIIIQGKE